MADNLESLDLYQCFSLNLAEDLEKECAKRRVKVN